MSRTFDLDIAQRAVELALEKGADYAEVRIEDTVTERASMINGRLRRLSVDRLVGAAVRVIVKGTVGFASTCELSREGLERAVEDAIASARAVPAKEPARLSEEEPCRGSFRLEGVKKHPWEANWEEKLELLRQAHDAAKLDNVRSITANYGAYYGEIVVINSEGTFVKFEPLLVGLAVYAVANVEGKVGDGSEFRGGSFGLEKFDDPEGIGRKAAERALEKARASPPPAGTFTVILMPQIAGLLAHESFGHLSEGDSVLSGASPLAERLGEQIASEEVTLIDAGVTPYGGYWLPVDDEGVPTKEVKLVERGVLKAYLHSRLTAGKAGTRSTGNGRAQDFRFEPIVRMRNTYFGPGDWKLEEIIEETKHGILVDEPQGGQANMDGTFSFGVSRGYIIENGEKREPIRDVVIAGNILEMLRYVDAAAKDVEIRSTPFGGCGKWGQRAFVGLGGPALRVTRLAVGGRR